MADNTREDLKAIASLKELMEEGPASTLNLDEDAWEFGAPPPHDVYELQCFPAKEMFKVGKINPKDPKSEIYVTANLECKVVSDNEEYDGTTVFVRLSTRLARGKNISTMAGFLTKLGYGETLKKAMPLTAKKVAQYLEAALKKEPKIKAELDWRGSYKFTNSKGEEEWVNKYNHYEDFPDDPENPGKKLHITTVKGKDGGSYEVRAQIQANRYFGKGEPIPEVKKKGGSAVSEGPKLAKVSELELQLDKPAATPATPTAATAESDELLMLE